jgi:hypothetical protein
MANVVNITTETAVPTLEQLNAAMDIIARTPLHELPQNYRGALQQLALKILQESIK